MCIHTCIRTSLGGSVSVAKEPYKNRGRYQQKPTGLIGNHMNTYMYSKLATQHTATHCCTLPHTHCNLHETICTHICIANIYRRQFVSFPTSTGGSLSFLQKSLTKIGVAIKQRPAGFIGDCRIYTWYTHVDCILMYYMYDNNKDLQDWWEAVGSICSIFYMYGYTHITRILILYMYKYTQIACMNLPMYECECVYLYT